jgi:hypothetical protein
MLRHYEMTYGGIPPCILDLGSEWSAYHPGHFTYHEERAVGVYWLGRCVGPRGGLEAVGKTKNF